MNELNYSVLSNFSLLFAILVFILLFTSKIITKKIIPKTIESIPKQIKAHTVQLYITATIFVFAFMSFGVNFLIAFNRFNIFILFNILCWLYIAIMEIKSMFVTMASIRILENIAMLEEEFAEENDAEI